MSYFEKEKLLKEMETELATYLASDDIDDEISEKIYELKDSIREFKLILSKNMEAWDRVQIARAKNRLTACDYIRNLFEDFMELHGDRFYADDESIVGGIATFNGQAVTVISQQKGRTTKENIKRNFAMPHPEGYRKSLRLMKQAEKFGRPIICFVDTPGAYPGLGAEERGQGEAIARNLFEISGLKVPVLTFIIGEGGSGGALALAVGDKVFMMENSIYSILSPEGFASILYKDASLASQVATDMKLTALDLLEMGIIDDVVTEPLFGITSEDEFVFNQMRKLIKDNLEELQKLPKRKMLNQRYDKYRNIGKN